MPNDDQRTDPSTILYSYNTVCPPVRDYPRALASVLSPV